MKKLLVSAMLCSLLSACGNSQIDAEAIGQAKKVSNVTPIICEDYPAFDLSLGVMRNGTGSISSQDMWFVVTNLSDVARLQEAVTIGAIVKVHYNVRRWAPCSANYWMTSVEILK